MEEHVGRQDIIEPKDKMYGLPRRIWKETDWLQADEVWKAAELNGRGNRCDWQEKKQRSWLRDPDICNIVLFPNLQIEDLETRSHEIGKFHSDKIYQLCWFVTSIMYRLCIKWDIIFILCSNIMSCTHCSTQFLSSAYLLGSALLKSELLLITEKLWPFAIVLLRHRRQQ